MTILDFNNAKTSHELGLDSIEFLRLLRPAGPWQLTAIDPQTGDIVTRTIRSAAKACEFVAEHNGRRNLYYAVNPVRIENIKASKTDVSAIEFLLGDLDPREGEASSAAKQRYLAALKSFQPEPMFVVDSGNGVQVLWRLDQPITLPKPDKRVDEKTRKPKWVLTPNAQAIIAENEGRSKAVMEKLGSKAGTQNIDRILRLPGTINLPSAKKKRDGTEYTAHLMTPS
jgi:hypothetical protein